jgi:hypothetical protein
MVQDVMLICIVNMEVVHALVQLEWHVLLQDAMKDIGVLLPILNVHVVIYVHKLRLHKDQNVLKLIKIVLMENFVVVLLVHLQKLFLHILLIVPLTMMAL